jgi:hypothetical protein
VWIQGAAGFVQYRFTLIVGQEVGGRNSFDTSGGAQGLVTLPGVPFNWANVTELETAYRGTTGLASPPEVTGTTIQDVPGTIEFIASARRRMSQQFVIAAADLTGNSVDYTVTISQQGDANGNRHMAFLLCNKEVVTTAGVSFSPTLVARRFVALSTSSIGAVNTESGSFLLPNP